MISDISALILTYNEEENISRCLDSLAWIPKVVVLDSLSTDRTQETARSFPNVEWRERKFTTHGEQWNAGLELIESAWVLTLDADYIVTPEVAAEIRQLEPPHELNGYAAAFRYLVFGQPLSASLYPPRVVLFRKSKGHYFDEGHTQQLRIGGDIPELRQPIWHDDRKPLSRWLVSQDRYAQLEAEHLLNAETLKTEKLKGVDRVRKAIMVAPLVMPFYLLIGRGLILDGWRGWYYTAQRTIAELLLSLRLLEKKLRP